MAKIRIKTTKWSGIIEAPIFDAGEMIANLKMTPEEAIELATALIKAARIASKEDN